MQGNEKQIQTWAVSINSLNIVHFGSVNLFQIFEF